MDAIEMQALLIRRDAAMAVLDQYDEGGRWELLSMIIDPSESVLEASLEMAEKGGATHLAHEMAVRTASDNARRRALTLF